MRKRTVKSGLIWSLSGVVLITMATFYHGLITRIFLLSEISETLFFFTGLIVGGVACCVGIIIAFVGMLLKNEIDGNVRFSHLVILLSAAIAIFFFLFFMSVSDRDQQDIKPGEIIYI
jgi:hypothetical protein